jgi:hypothetical protein
VTAHGLTGDVLAERADVAMGVQGPVTIEPRRAPSEAGETVALEALGERPQRVDPERLRGHGHVLLAHGAMIRRVAGYADEVELFARVRDLVTGAADAWQLGHQ